MECIYLDVLIITNIYVTWFILKATARITHSFMPLKRLALASFVGGAGSLIIVIDTEAPKLWLMTAFLKIVCVTATVLLAFPKLRPKRLIKLSVVFLAVNLAFAGVALIFAQLVGTRIVYIKNTTVYFDFSLLTLILSTIVAYVVICLSSVILSKKLNEAHSFTVEIDTGEAVYLLSGVADTGNTLTDTFSGKPVIICSNQSLSQELEQKQGAPPGFRLLPYSTIGNSGVIPAFMPRRIIIRNEVGEIKLPDAFVGVIDTGSSRAIFNPNILV